MANLETKAANWAIARARWEGEPRCSYSDLTDFLGVSKQAIAKRAKKDGWQKKLNMSDIVDRAHAAADRAIAQDAADQSKVAALVDGRTNAGAVPLLSKAPTPAMLASAVEDAAVDARAQILTRHRNEWPAVRAQIYKVLKTPTDVDAARIAKLAAESIKLLQDGERKAWGIDAGAPDEKVARIVIERTEGVRVVR